jgi:hypothetical protein
MGTKCCGKDVESKPPNVMVFEAFDWKGLVTFPLPSFCLLRIFFPRLIPPSIPASDLTDLL